MLAARDSPTITGETVRLPTANDSSVDARRRFHQVSPRIVAA